MLPSRRLAEALIVQREHRQRTDEANVLPHGPQAAAFPGPDEGDQSVFAEPRRRATRARRGSKREEDLDRLDAETEVSRHRFDPAVYEAGHALEIFTRHRTAKRRDRHGPPQTACPRTERGAARIPSTLGRTPRDAVGRSHRPIVGSTDRGP